jgi:hypothetical protein
MSHRSRMGRRLWRVGHLRSGIHWQHENKSYYSVPAVSRRHRLRQYLLCGSYHPIRNLMLDMHNCFPGTCHQVPRHSPRRVERLSQCKPRSLARDTMKKKNPCGAFCATPYSISSSRSAPLFAPATGNADSAPGPFAEDDGFHLRDKLYLTGRLFRNFEYGVARSSKDRK